MTFIWLIVWLIEGTPHVSFVAWNVWAVSLAICAGIDIFGYRERSHL
jgi:hypothetical protein